MAGMLPGVECARRRRFHRGGGFTESRRSSFCLYTSNYETHLNSSESLQRNKPNQSIDEEKLGFLVREAKDKLDERLKTQRKSEIKRDNSKESIRCKNGVMNLSSVILENLHIEVFGSKKSNSRRFKWRKLGWKASDQDECAVCLEWFKAGETLVHLPCAHKFHSSCLVPWLESTPLCPCCRMKV